MVTPKPGASAAKAPKAKAAPAKRGRPCLYTEAIANEICERLAAGESLRAICADGDAAIFPSEAAIRGWALDDVHGFSARYSRARNIGLDAKAEQALEIATDKTRDPNCRRVEIDAIKWFASKLRPDKYGDRTTLAGDPNAPLAPPTINVNFLGPKE